MTPAEIIRELLGLAELVVSKVAEYDDFEWRHAVWFVGSDGETDVIGVSPRDCPAAGARSCGRLVAP